MTIFGPGVGECVVLHLGNGDWGVVDSCISPGQSVPVALGYLSQLGIDPAESVRWILATHWHDDHIRGLADVLRACPQAKFAMSGALATQQFFQLVLEVNASNRLVSHNSSASEFAEILDLLGTRASSGYVVGPDMYAQDGMRLYQGGHKGAAELWALSPSAATVTNAKADLVNTLLTSGSARRFKQFSPNDLSVAVLVRVASFSLLLGADLENAAPGEFGWKAVLSSQLRPKQPAEVFKIAHHGSSNADHAAIWDTMLVNQPIAVVTPYARLQEPRPRNTDVQRIKGRTNAVFCTTWPPTKKPRKRQGVDGIVGGATRTRRALNTLSGSIRLRVDLDGEPANPQVELFGGAKQL
jgi:hypothetical protein